MASQCCDFLVLILGKTWMGAAFSTRLGGVSEGYLSSMNFGWKQGDDLENVKENYRLFAGAIGVSAR